MTKQLFGFTPARLNSFLTRSSNTDSDYSQASVLSPHDTFYVPDQLSPVERDRFTNQHTSPHNFHPDYTSHHSSATSDISDVTILSVQSESLNEPHPQPHTLQHPSFNLVDMLQTEKVSQMSVFDACVLLQAGFSVHKNKLFRSLGMRRVWLNPQCTSICWTSKKKGVSVASVSLAKVIHMSNNDLKVSIHLEDGYRLSLVFRNQWEADVYLRALSGLIRSLALIQAPPDVVLSLEDRRRFSLIEDTFNGRPLRDYRSVGAYILLTETTEHPQNRGLHLVYSSLNGFRCMRYIPSRAMTGIAGSQSQKDTLMSLTHPNLVKYYDILSDAEEGDCYMIHENVSQGSLFDCKNVDTVRCVPETTARTITRDTLNALSYLHSLRIAHGSVRPGTLMRGVDGSVKLDPIGCLPFNMTDEEKIAAIARSRCVEEAMQFMSPELCSLSTPCMKHSAICKSDIWSVGVLCFGLLYGDTPFGGVDNADIRKKISTEELKLPDLPHISRQAKDFLRRILGDKDHAAGIKMEALQDHSWYNPRRLPEIRLFPTRFYCSTEE